MPRAFIAIEIPAEIKKTIAAQTAALRSEQAQNLRWVSSENMHLTLKFLGEFSQENLERMFQEMQQEAAQVSPFEIASGGLGCFPNPRQARVLWIGLRAPAVLGKLVSRLDAAAARLGCLLEERPFTAHLSIGRVKEGLPAQELTRLQTSMAVHPVGETGRFMVENLTLFRSELRPQGSLYTPLNHARLGEPL